MAAGRKNALFFAGDTGQRIFQPPFSWKSLGVDVRGRAPTLRVTDRDIDRRQSHIRVPGQTTLPSP